MTAPSAVLYDIDSRIPNLALMKLSAHYKRRGYRVLLSRDCSYIKSDRHAASAILSTGKAARKIAALRNIYGADIDIGGSGVSLEKRLDPKVESCFPDYGLYRHRAYAVGYLTRGCGAIVEERQRRSCPPAAAPRRDAVPRPFPICSRSGRFPMHDVASIS